jgi:hypothetical protein
MWPAYLSELTELTTLHSLVLSMEQRLEEQIFMDLYAHYFRTYTERQWQTMFGVALHIVVMIWRMLTDPPFKREHLLMAINYLKTYSLTDLGHIQWNLSKPTWRKYIWLVLEYLYEHLNVIDWTDRRTVYPLLHQCYAVIDVTLCPIQMSNRNHDQRAYYSVKHKRHGVKYEIAVSYIDGRIVWISGPYVGSAHDLTILREGGLFEHLNLIEILMGDKGYVGDYNLWYPFKGRVENMEEFQRIWNKWLNSNRTVVENAISRLKKMQCLVQEWRNPIEKHAIVFKVCANIIELELESQAVALSEIKSLFSQPH